MTDTDRGRKDETATKGDAAEKGGADAPVEQPAIAPKKLREDRLAEALRSNLRRRKSAAKDRATDV